MEWRANGDLYASQMFLMRKIPASPFSLNPNLNISHRVVISSSVKYLTV